jgi:hypothetical protein
LHLTTVLLRFMLEVLSILLSSIPFLSGDLSVFL